MPKYTCHVRAFITETYEVCDTIEIDAPDEIQAEEDAITAAENAPLKMWLSHSLIKENEDIDTHFEIEELEEDMRFNE